MTGRTWTARAPSRLQAWAGSAHVFRVRARRPAGAASKPAEYSWTIVATTQAGRRARRQAAATDRHDRPRAAVDFTQRHVCVAHATHDEGAVPARRCTLASGAQPRTYLGLGLGRHVFRLRSPNGHGKAEHGQPIRLDDHGEPRTSPSDSLVSTGRRNDSDGGGLRVLGRRRRRRRMPSRQRTLGELFERGHVRRSRCGLSPVLCSGGERKRSDQRRDMRHVDRASLAARSRGLRAVHDLGDDPEPSRAGIEPAASPQDLEPVRLRHPGHVAHGHCENRQYSTRV